MSATPLPVNRVAGSSGDFARLALLTACFVLSGFAALVYQTAWTRQFALVFGTSELAVATVLAAYMGGLALGAALAERWLPRIERPVLVYAGLELGIGASALVLVPLLLLASDALLHALFGSQPAPPDSEQVSTTLFHLVSAFVALAIPTTLMGATLPLLARHAVHRDEQVGRRIGALYAANTAGAVCGALATAFVLLPHLGLTATVRVGAVVNIAVFVLAALVARGAAPRTALSWEVFAGEQRSGSAPSDASGTHGLAAPRARWRAPPAPVWVLPLMLASGAVSFFHEVLWTRMLSHVLGSSIYAFGVMVASFLAGIAIGGGFGALLARDRQRAALALSVAQVACGIAGAGAYLALGALLPEKAGLLENAFFAATLLMPLTLAIGVTYPLAVRVLAEGAADAAPSSARVYAWNTVGAIAGALAAGFVAIPALRYEGAVQVAVGASALLALLSAFALVRLPRLIAAGVALAAVATIALFQPVRPDRLLVTSPLNLGTHGRIVHYEVGRSADVIVLEQDGSLALRTNGLPEALMELPGSPPRYSGEFWLSPLAVLARPQTETMLVVGYGGGVVLEAAPPSVREIDVIELEPHVIEANRSTSHLRKRDPLLDPRINVIVNDARAALALTSKTWDAIVSQPSHPWTAGASHLYTREFMLQAREHLAPEGVFVQWMNVSFVDETLLRSLAATLLDVFGEVRIYRPDPNTLVFLASRTALELERSLTADPQPLARAPIHYARVGINTPEDIVAALAADGDGTRALAHGAELVTDDHNRMATSSVYELGRGLTAEGAGRILAAYDPVQRPDSWVHRELGERLAFDYIARRAAAFIPLDISIRDRLQNLARAREGTDDAAYITALLLGTAGQGERAARYAREMAGLHPDSDVLNYELVRPFTGALAQGRAPPEILDAAARVRGAGEHVLEAVRHAARGEWRELPRLDDELAATAWTSPWKLDAVSLRADWRVRVSNPDLRRKLGYEAVVLLDQVLVATPTVGLFALRARAALAAEQPDTFLESVRGYARGAFSAVPTEPARRAELRATIDGLLALLEQHAAGKVDAERVREVREQLETARRRLEPPN